MYYRNADEISAILQNDPGLRSRFTSLARSGMPAVNSLARSGRATISAGDLLGLHGFLVDLQARSGARLRMDIDFILRGIETGWLLRWLGVTVT